MEYNLDSKSVGTLNVCLESVCEQSVDLDLTLPDYCPDIEKILKCSLTPQIFSKNLTGGQLVIDGTSVVEILYVDAIKKNIRCCEQTVPFSAVFNLKEPAENYVTLASAKTDYLNCRALSPRKLTLHGAFSLYAKVLSKKDEKIFVKSDDSDLETLSQSKEFCSLTALCQEQFSISEDISSANKPPVEAMLSKKASISISGIRVIPGKVMVKGDVSVKLLYLSDLDSGEPQQLDYIFPWERIIDCTDVNEDTKLKAQVDLLSFDIRLKSDMLGDSPSVSVDIKAAVCVKGYNTIEADVVLDAYSTDYQCEPEYVNPRLLTSITQLNETVMNKSAVDTGDVHIKQAVDMYCENFSCAPIVTEQGITLNCKASVCILAVNTDDYPCYVERIIDFEHTFPADVEFNNVNSADVRLKSLSYRLSDDSTLEIRCETDISAELSNSEVCNCVSCAKCFEDKPLPKSSCGLTLYYAGKGEKIWDIAKHYNTRLKLILQENALETDLLESPSMLMIPGI